MGIIVQCNGMSLEQFQVVFICDGLFYFDVCEQVCCEMVISCVCQCWVVECIQVSEQEVKNFFVLDMGKIQFFEEYCLVNILILVLEVVFLDVIQVVVRQVQEFYQQFKQGVDFG